MSTYYVISVLHYCKKYWNIQEECNKTEVYLLCPLTFNICRYLLRIWCLFKNFIHAFVDPYRNYYWRMRIDTIFLQNYSNTLLIIVVSASSSIHLQIEKCLFFCCCYRFLEHLAGGYFWKSCSVNVFSVYV